ncbi:MAG: hypothetical protein CM15mP106_4630 [Candidatus Neomarinimicrobiota bacterium]|nr:MAG: hypothetical protein CM15mP106_4630 [Candidatus Neomarinimicrobiota bacterium]
MTKDKMDESLALAQNIFMGHIKRFMAVVSIITGADRKQGSCTVEPCKPVWFYVHTSYGKV